MNLFSMKKLKLYFCLLCVIFFLIFGYLLIQNPSGQQLNIFHQHCNELFNDFTDLLRGISNTATINLYDYETNHRPKNLPHSWLSYLPLSYMSLYPFSCLLPYAQITYAQCFANPLAIFSACFFVCTSFVLLFLCLRALNKTRPTFFILIALFLSAFTLYAMERANLAIVCAAFIAIFLKYYNGETRRDRILAIIGLSVAAVLKIYPVLLGFLWLYKRRYRDIFIAAGVTIILAFAPFFFFNGGFFAQISALHKNLSYLNNEWFVFNYIYYFNLFHVGLLSFFSNPITYPAFIALTKIFSWVLVILAIILAGFVRTEWKRILLIIGAIMFIPSAGALYYGLYIFPVIIIFFNQEKFARLDIFYALLFALFLCPLRFFSGWIEAYSVNIMALSILWLSVMTGSAYQLRNKKLFHKINLGQSVLAIVAICLFSVAVSWGYLRWHNQDYLVRAREIALLRYNFGLNLTDEMYAYIAPPSLMANREKFANFTAQYPEQLGVNVDLPQLAERLGINPPTAENEHLDFVSGTGTLGLNARGLARGENSGLVNDAGNFPRIRLHLNKFLRGKYKIGLKINALPHYVGKEVVLLIGGQTAVFKPTATPQIYNLLIDLAQPTNLIEIIPTHPQSPAELGSGSDQRRLTIILYGLTIDRDLAKPVSVIDATPIELPALE